MRTFEVFRRLAFGLPAVIVAASLLGCGDQKPATGTQTQVPPEIEKANKNMEDFMKNQPKK